MPSVNAKDLPPALLKQLGIKQPPQTAFSKESVRSHALRILNAIAGLTQSQRDRVLKHAVKVNQL